MNLQALSIAVTATLGIVQIAKSAGFPSRFSPLLALLVGIGMTLLFTGAFSWTTVAIGVLTGLTAGGAYSGAKSLANS